MATPLIITLGCRLNAYESEVIRENAAGAGLDDAIIVNTCAVTCEAVRQAVARWDALELEEAIIAAKGAGGMVRSMDEWAGHPQAHADLGRIQSGHVPKGDESSLVRRESFQGVLEVEHRDRIGRVGRASSIGARAQLRDHLATSTSDEVTRLVGGHGHEPGTDPFRVSQASEPTPRDGPG